MQTAQAQTTASPSDGDKEMNRRRMAVRDAMLEVQEGRNAYASGRYTEAEEHYRNALAVIPKVPATEKQVVFISQSLADALVAKAMDYRKVGRNDEARTFLLEAIQLDPENARAKQELAYTEDPTRNNPALSPQHVGNVAEVQRLLELGYGYYDLADFDKADDAFQAVLRIDPYNSAARRGIEAVQNRRSAYYNEAARPANRAKMLADVDRQWEEQVPDPEALPDYGAVDGGQMVVDSDVRRDCAERLEAMVMPNIVFDGANVIEVAEALQNQILRFEASEGAAGGRHINITTNFGSKDSPGYQNLMQQEIRLNLADVSVKDVLDLLCEQLGIQYFYTEIGVELCLGGRDSGPMVDRVFVVPPHFFDDNKDDDDDDDDDGFGADSVSVGRVNPKQALMALGITFPEGSSVSYSPASRTLRVRNTMQNLQDIETALDVSDAADCQLVLSVIVMEVSQDELEQLGFDWLFNVHLGRGTDTYLSGGAAQTVASEATGAPVITAELGRNVSPNMTSGLRDAGALRSSNDIEGLIQYGAPASMQAAGDVRSPSIFGVRGVWSEADVTFVMRGLSQKKDVDILQNPKIVFSPGNDEQIAFGCVQEMYFPETWEQGSVQTANNGNRNGNRNANDFSFSPIATGAHPTDFVRMGCVDDEIDGIGTTLVIHSAELEETAQGTFINLALTTTVKEFEGFINWGSPINSVVINQRGDVQHIQLTPNYILQPMFKKRMENTNIRIAPGSVIVIGGLKEARSIQFEDKIPVLGDLPLIGRLFRSTGETQTRKALIFFVKVDYVDPTGRNMLTGGEPSSEQ